MARVDIPDEAVDIAILNATAAGESLASWLAKAINDYAAGQGPIVEIPYDDCGFYSPYSRVATA